jgi:hypothetical protein
MRIAGAISCWILFVTVVISADGPITAELLAALLLDNVVVVVVAVVVVVVVKGFIVVVVVVVVADSLDNGPGLQMTPAASDSSQSLMPQPSKRQSVKLFSPPTQ